MAVPNGWLRTEDNGTAEATSLVEWWRRFDDPLLSSLIDGSLRGNTSGARAEGGLRQSTALRDAAGAALLPSLRGFVRAAEPQVMAASLSGVEIEVDALAAG